LLPRSQSAPRPKQGEAITVRHIRRLAAAITLAAIAVAASASVAAAEPLPPGGAAILSWTPAQQLVGYRNMEKIAPTRLIRRGANVHPLPRGAVQIDPKWTWAGRAWDTASYMAAMRTSGVIVLKDGKVALERYGLGRRPGERWTSFSVAKSITSTLLGAAIADGYIKSLDAPVTDYIPELKGSAYEGVTIRQLLTMTSGVKWNEDYSDPHSDVAQAGAVLEPGVNPIVSYMRRLPRADPPGAKWVYKTGETDLAGVLVSNAVGRPLADYLSQKIWAPYGMEADAAWVEDAGGHERGGCCISMTLRDYARFGQFMLDGGKAGGRDVLPPGWIADATAQHVKLPPKEGVPGYGYFWWIGDDSYAAEGIFGQEIIVFPNDGVVVAINSAWAHADDDADWAAQAAFAEALRAAAVAAH
jgi:CubicO group peptidase (beta-lactamase class C family)